MFDFPRFEPNRCTGNRCDASDERSDESGPRTHSARLTVHEGERQAVNDMVDHAHQAAVRAAGATAWIAWIARASLFGSARICGRLPFFRVAWVHGLRLRTSRMTGILRRG